MVNCVLASRRSEFADSLLQLRGFCELVRYAFVRVCTHPIHTVGGVMVVPAVRGITGFLCTLFRDVAVGLCPMFTPTVVHR
jgi:hypothetical protein